MPQFSIIIPCFNAEKTIAQTLKGFQAQTVSDWEAICIDDGSTDETREIIREFSQHDERIRLVFNLSKGPSAARNYGAKNLARAPLLSFCDADDIWHPSKLRSLQTAFQDETVTGAFGQIAFFSVVPGDATVLSKVPQSDLTVDILLGENPVCTASNINFRRNAFLASGGFCEDMVHNEDLEWLVRVVGAGHRFSGLNALHTYYRTSPNGLSSDLGAMETSRQIVVQSAVALGATPSKKSQAIYSRYLARRALRMGNRLLPLRYVLEALAASPAGFFTSPRRGALTLSAALGVLILPRFITRPLFS
ncbi:glycosyltransferase [Rhodobacteraceae bacterium D3-12]|nr:glycosyltransferase [Rhodobacteraceae bacterium D3-12]